MKYRIIWDFKRRGFVIYQLENWFWLFLTWVPILQPWQNDTVPIAYQSLEEAQKALSDYKESKLGVKVVYSE